MNHACHQMILDQVLCHIEKVLLYYKECKWTFLDKVINQCFVFLKNKKGSL